MSKVGSVKDVGGRVVSIFIGAVQDQWQLYSDSPDDYEIGSPIGFGASSTVYIATYRPHSESNTTSKCALKVIDLDALPLKALLLLKRETQLMSLSKHPNVLRVRGTWITGHKLYIAMRLMKSGSAADVMRYGYPDGLEEDVCRCILKQALEGLNYLHVNEFIHRDLKAANLLIDDDGTVLLGDLGVAVALSDDDSSTNAAAKKIINFEKGKVIPRPSHPIQGTLQTGKRRSFVGTPCWMAPEVISQKQYDSKADIWSFGITALELTQGRAPHSRELPHKVLTRILHDQPPTMDRDGGPFKYSEAFQDMIESCLLKDPALRPTAQQLLRRAFFRPTKKKSYLVNTILRDLPPLTARQERRRPTHASRSIGTTLQPWDFSSLSQQSSEVTNKMSQDVIDNHADGNFQPMAKELVAAQAFPGAQQDLTTERPDSQFNRKDAGGDSIDTSVLSGPQPTPSVAASPTVKGVWKKLMSRNPSILHLRRSQ